MNRTNFLSVAGGALATSVFASVAEAAESDATLATATGTIAGTFEVVPGAKSPVVLIIAGSGPTTRDGNNGSIHPETYRLLAAALAARGVSSLRYDKRGIAASAGAAPSESAIRFDTYVDDAAAWIQQLRADKRFSKIVVAGHSEGSLVGMIAAQRATPDAFVSLEGAGRPAAIVIREQLKPQLPPDLYARADEILAQLEHGNTVANTPPELDVLFRASVQPYLISWFKYDPATEIAKLRVPITIVQGTADVQVTMADAQALHRGAPNARFIVIDGMNHVLKYAPDTSSPAAIAKGYDDPSLPVDPHVVEAIYQTA